MATEADIPLPVAVAVCEARGEQVADNIVKICVSEVEVPLQDEKHNEVPIVEDENFLKSPSTDEVHCNVEKTWAAGESNSIAITPELKVGDPMNVSQLSKETSSDHHSSNENDKTESHTPCISEGGEELNVQSKTTDDKSVDEKPTGEDMSSNLTNETASEQEALQNETSCNTTSEDQRVSSLSESHADVENAATESSPDSQIQRDEQVSDNVVPEATDNVKDLKEAELPENEQSTTTLAKEDSAESFYVAPENIDLSQENSVKGPPENQSRNLTLHGDTIQAEEATIDSDDGHKESLETFPTTVSSSHEEGSMNAVLQEATSDSTEGKIIDEVDNHKEVLENLSSGEGNCEDVSPEKTDQTVKDGSDTSVDRPVELATDEETSAKEILQNAEESNSSDKDGSRDVVCSTDSSETKVGDTLVDHNINDAEVASQLCKDTSSDPYATNDSSGDNVSLAEEILHETESHPPCISEVEEPTVQVKTTDNESVDEKVSEEGESDHNKMTSEQEGLENETTTTLETSNSDELQSKTDLNSSLEEETAIQESKEPVRMPEDYGVPSEKTLSESHGEDSATDHSDPKLVEKSEESSLVQVEDSQIDHDEHLEEESQGLPLTEASNDNVSPATDEVKEDSQIENPAESLQVPLENIQVSNANQENNIDILPEEQSNGSTNEAEEATVDATEERRDSHESFPPIVSGSPEEGSMNVVLQEVTSDYTDKKINDVVDKHEEASEVQDNLSTTVSTEDAQGNSLIKLEGSENEKEDDYGKESEETSLAREVSDASMFLHEARYEDGQPKKDEFCDDERDTESMLPKTESKTENTEDVHINSEDAKAPESVDRRSEGGTIDAAAEKEQTVENVSNEDRDKDLLAASGMTRDINLEEEPERPSLTEKSKDEASDKDSVLLEPKTSYEYPSKVELPNDEKSTDCTTPEKEDLQPEDHETSNSTADIETTCSVEERSLEDNSQTITSNKITGAADKKDLVPEVENVATETPHEHIEESSVDCSAREDEERLEEDNQNSSIEAPEETKARESGNVDEPKNRGEESTTPELEVGENTESRYETDVEKHIESLEVKPEDIKQHDSSPDINKSIEEEPSNTDPREISTDKAERGSVDAAHTNEENVATEDVAKDIPDCNKEDSMAIEEENPSIEASAESANDKESPKVSEGGLIMKEEPLKSLQVATQDIETRRLSGDRETSSVDEEAIIHDNKEELPDNATGEEDQTPTDKDAVTSVPNGDSEDKSPIQVDGLQEPSSEEVPAEKINDDKPTTTHEAKFAYENTVKANLHEDEQKIECAPVKEEVHIESLQAADEDIKDTSSGQDREASHLEEQAPTTDSHETMYDEKYTKTLDSTDLKKETLEDKNFAATPDEDTKEDSQNQVDGLLLEQEEHSVEVSESTSLSDARKDDITESTLLEEVAEVEDPIDSSQVASEDIKAFAPCQVTERSSTVEQILHPEDSSSNKITEKIVDAIGEETQEAQDIAKRVPQEDEERLEEDNQNSLIEAPEETGARESGNNDEPKNRGEESITPELENGANAESMCETDVQKHIDSLQVKPEDIIQHDSSPDISKSIEEEPSNTDPQEISTDKAERESVDAAQTNEESVETEDVAKDIPDCDKEDSMAIEEVGSQNPLIEASAESANDKESPKVSEGCLTIKEEPLKSLQVAAQDIETPPLSRDREASSVDEESPATNPEAIMHDNKEEIPDNATGEEDQTPMDKQDIGIDILGGKEDDMPIEEVGSQKPLNEASAGNTNIEESTKITQGSLIEEEASPESLQEAAQEIETPHLSREREISSPDEQSPIANPEGIRDDNKEKIADSETGLEQNIANNTTPYEDKEEHMNESENIPSSEAPMVSSTESGPVKEEEKVEMPTEVQILTADPQETCDETQKKTVDAADKNNDAVISVPNEDSEDKSPIQVDGLQESSSEEVPAEKINDDKPTTTHEAKFAYENTVKANLHEDEEKIECAPVKEEVHIESLQAADEDIKDTSSGQDREASHLEEQAPTTDSHETIYDEKCTKTLDSTDLKKETLEDKNFAATPDEDTTEDSRNQVDGLLLEQEEHLVKVSESTSLSDDRKDDIRESTLVEEEAEVEDPIDSSQVAAEDVKAFAPCQDTERSSTVEQILDPEDTSSNKITEKIVAAIGEETQEAQDIAKSVPQEDDSPNEQNTEATLIKEDVSIELPQIASEDREEPCLSEVRETNSQEEQILCASPGARINDNEEDKTIDPTVFENETPKDEVPKEMESVDAKRETEEEEGFKGVQITTAVTVASNQERSLNLTDEDLDVNKDVIGHIPVVSNCKQQDSPVMKVSEEHMMTSNEHVLDSTGMESEVSDKIQVLNDGPTAVPTSESLAETEVHVPNGEKEAELFKQEALPNFAASEDVSESKEVNGEEEIDSNNSKEIASSPISVASEEVSTSNVALEEDLAPYSVTDLETKNEEEAPAIKETTPSSTEGQDAENKSVEENSNYVGSLTQEKSDSNEVAFTPGECESNTRSLESIAQGQSFDIISETEETKTEEEDLRAKAGIQSDKDVTEEIVQEETTIEKEIMKSDISSEKEQLPRIKEEHEDIKDYHQGSCEEEVITDSHQEDEVKQDQQLNSKETYEFTNNENDTETVPEVSEEADDKAPEDLEEKIVTNEAIDNILHQEEQVTSIKEPTTKIDNENARELDISCVKTDTQDSNKEAVQIAVIPGRESEEQNKEDEICRSDEVQAKDEENLILSESKSVEEDEEAYVEAQKFDLSSQTKDISECAISDVGQEDSEKSTTKKFSEEKITECEDISLKEQPSEDAEAEAGIDLGAAVPVPEATGLESKEVEELNDKCTEMADTSTPVETSGESTPLEPKNQQTKLDDLPEESDTEVKMAEKDDEVNLQSEQHNPEERMETIQGQETKAIQNEAVSVSEQETEEQKVGRDSGDIHEEDKHIPSQLESVDGAATESSIHQSCVEDTAQDDKKVKTSENEAAPSLKDKHVLHDTRNLIPENLHGDNQVVKASKVEEEEEECGNKKMEGKPESSLADDEKKATQENNDEDEEESHEHTKSDLSSDAPVMVDIGDADIKVAHKKSHNILSGVGSKVKHSIAKVKKAITGKSPSPKKVINPESK